MTPTIFAFASTFHAFARARENDVVHLGIDQNVFNALQAGQKSDFVRKGGLVRMGFGDGRFQSLQGNHAKLQRLIWFATGFFDFGEQIGSRRALRASILAFRTTPAASTEIPPTDCCPNPPNCPNEEGTLPVRITKTQAKADDGSQGIASERERHFFESLRGQNAKSSDGRQHSHDFPSGWKNNGAPPVRVDLHPS